MAYDIVLPTPSGKHQKTSGKPMGFSRFGKWSTSIHCIPLYPHADPGHHNNSSMHGAKDPEIRWNMCFLIPYLWNNLIQSATIYVYVCVYIYILWDLGCNKCWIYMNLAKCSRRICMCIYMYTYINWFATSELWGKNKDLRPNFPHPMATFGGILHF